MSHVVGDSAALEYAELNALPKAKLIVVILEQRLVLLEKDKKIAALTEQLAEYRQAQSEQQKKDINKTVNQPTSKKPEWDKDGNPKPPKSRKSKRTKRPGCGNQKKARTPDKIHFNPLDTCPHCQEDLSNRPGTATIGRIVEDIAPPSEHTTVSQEIEEMKWCPRCRNMVSSKTQKALPGSDMGLNASIEMAYLWVVSALSLPKIQALFRSFNALKLSTAGISSHLIRLSGILQPIYDEILGDVKAGSKIWADETGWRVKGKLWWLWIFANERSAYYWAESCRGSPVVERLLGKVFYGVLIVDGWHAYHKIVCAKQTCMAHIFRKVRAFINAYPQYRSILSFYLKLRRIIRQGEQLQKKRSEVGEEAFQRRLKALHGRLEQLLRWKKPNVVLKEIIDKVRRQQDKILTFVEHEGVPHHNNYGEYIIKKGVIKRKMSGGSTSADGAKAYACIQSIAMTCQLRKIPFHQFMKESLVQYIRTGKVMLLSAYEAKQKNMGKKEAA